MGEDMNLKLTKNSVLACAKTILVFGMLLVLSTCTTSNVDAESFDGTRMPGRVNQWLAAAAAVKDPEAARGIALLRC